jgi:penicillin-binding protein 1A
VDIRAGAPVEGASTITQQYVKNAYLSHDQSITRKVKEALIAVELERSVYKDNKDQVIADYLNTVYFGSNAYGVQAASETYFGKSVSDLSIAESATLVGLLWSPSTLGQDRDGAWAQRDLVLRKMFETGYISSQDYNGALEVPLPEKWPAGAMVETGLQGPSTTRSFTDLVEEELIARYGANTVLQGGMSVYTTIDLETQVAAREILYGPEGYLPGADDPDLALVSLDPETGRIKAMVGNRDPEAQFNLVTQGRRQPGSAFKPFALIAALEQGIDPDTEFVSEKKEYTVEVSGSDRPEKWKVENYDGIVRGRIPLKEALWWSDNTVFTDLVMNANGNGLEYGGLRPPPPPFGGPRHPGGLAAGHGDGLRHDSERGPQGGADHHNQGGQQRPGRRRGPLRRAGRDARRAGHRRGGSPQGDRAHDRGRNGGHRQGRLARGAPRRRQDRDEREFLRRLVCRLRAADGYRGLDGLRRGRRDPRVHPGLRPQT